MHSAVPLANQKTTDAALPAGLSLRAGLLLVLILPLFALAPLLYPGYLQTHSGLVPLWNIADLRAHLGDWRWTPHLATEFHPLRSAGLLPYYLAALLPLSPANAVKTVLGVSWLLGGLGLFLWLRSWLGGGGALLAALIYTYLPFQIGAVYVRGAWGEVLFWGLLPWAILAATYLVTTPKLTLVPLAGLVWLLLGLSHLGLTLWALLFLAALVLLVHFRQAGLPLLAAGLGTALAGGLVAGLAPFPTGERMDAFSDHFLYPFQLFVARWGFGVSRPGWDDGLSFQLGLAALGVGLLGVLVWQRRAAAPDSPAGRTDRRLLFFGGVVGLLTLLQFGFTAPLWRLPLWPGLILADLLSYPWQLLGFVGLGLAVLAGAALWLDPSLTRRPVLAALVLLVILSVYPYLLPQFSPAGLPPLQAELGPGQLSVVDHDFSALTSGHTVGLERGQTELPLAVHGPLQANDILSLDVTWHPLQPFDQDLKIFVHLVDPNDNVLAQFDGPPRQGTYPTSGWLPGEMIEDSYPILFPAEAPPGPYRVFLGLYDETTLERLPVPGDSQGRVIFDVQ